MSVKVFTKEQMEERRENGFFSWMNRRAAQAQFLAEMDKGNARLHKLRLRYKKAVRAYWLWWLAQAVNVAIVLGMLAFTMNGLIHPDLSRWIVGVCLIACGWIASSTFYAGKRKDAARKKLESARGC